MSMSEKRNKKNAPKKRKKLSGFEEWGGYMAAKKSKLSNQFADQKDIVCSASKTGETEIFKGISIFVTGYTKPPASELKTLMLIHGGTFSYYYTPGKTTHIVASNLPYSKIKKLNKEVVVTADWITESIKSGKLLSHHDFLLYPPEITKKQQRLNIGSYFVLETNSSTNNTKNDDLERKDLLGVDINIENNEPSISRTSENHDFKIPSPEMVCGSEDLFNSPLDKSPSDTDSNLNSSCVSTSVQIDVKIPAEVKSPAQAISPGSEDLFGSSKSTSSNGCLANIPESDVLVPDSVEIKSTSNSDSITFSPNRIKSTTDSDISTENSVTPSTNFEIPDSMGSTESSVVHDSSLDAEMSGGFNESTDMAKDKDWSKKDSVVPDSSFDAEVSEGFNESTDLTKNKDFSKKDPATMKAGHPEFLSEFYSNSRLHHISTSGQELKRYVQQLSDGNKERSFPARSKLTELGFATADSNSCEEYVLPQSQSIIMHLDMDCFFVSVGLRNHPELKGQPVAVAHSKGKRNTSQTGSDLDYEINYYANLAKKKAGSTSESDTNAGASEAKLSHKNTKEFGSMSEIASCSYEARKFGLRNGMLLGEAMRRCPNLKIIPYDFEGYSEVSKLLYDTVACYTLDIEAVSCDELYIDCTQLIQDTNIFPCQFASVLRAEIELKTNCTASVGIGDNMLLARLANKVAKPNGQHYVQSSEVENFMQKQKIGDLPGVGYSTSSKLKQQNVLTCGDLQKWKLSKIQQEFGTKNGQSLYNKCRGKDDRSVQLQKDPKSVSAEINYGIRFEKEDDVKSFINELASEVQSRLQKIGCKGKSITLKLMVRKSDAPVETAKFMGHGVCDHMSKSVSVRTATDSSVIIAKECIGLAQSFKIKPQDFRGVGIQVSKLESAQSSEKSTKTLHKFLSHKNEMSKKKEDSNSSCTSTTSRTDTANSSIKTSADAHSLTLLKSPEIEDAECRKIEPTNKSSPLVVQVIENGRKTSKASIGGCSDITEVKSLIEEWIGSTSDPLDVDMEEIRNYLLQLADEDLDDANSVLEGFFRLASSADEVWKQAYLTILSYIQQKVLQNYGSMLAANSDFPT